MVTRQGRTVVCRLWRTRRAHCRFVRYNERGNPTPLERTIMVLPRRFSCSSAYRRPSGLAIFSRRSLADRRRQIDVARQTRNPLENRSQEGIESSAAIVKDTVYVGCYDEHLHAYDLATGQLRWKPSSVPSRPRPASIRAKSTSATRGIFYCVDADTGMKLWSFETNGEISGGATCRRQGHLRIAGRQPLLSVDQVARVDLEVQDRRPRLRVGGHRQRPNLRRRLR